MENMSHMSQSGVAVNTSRSLQTSMVSSHVTPRTSHNVGISPNITFTQTPSVAQIVFQNNAKTETTQLRYPTNSGQPQPLIIGNVNAASILTAALTNGSENAMALSSEMMGFSPTVNSNSFIGIVPVFIQQEPSSSLFLPSTGRPVAEKSNSVIISQDGGGCVASLGNATLAANSPSQCGIQQQSAKIVPTSDQPAVLSSSDTVILHRLSSQDTLKLPSQSVTSSSELNFVQPPNLSSSHLSSNFSLLSNVSNRSVSLTSIPTASLFSPEQTEMTNSENTSVPFTPIIDKDNRSNHMPANNFKGTSDSISSDPDSEVQTKIAENKKKKRERLSESEPCQLQIDESADASTCDTEIDEPEVSDSRGCNLSRSDTVILNEEPSVSKKNNSAPAACDTVILMDTEEFVKSKSKSSEGFVTDSVQFASSNSTMEPQGYVPPSNNSSPSLLSQKQTATSSIKLDALQSVPSLILSDSMVNGMYNPNFFCSLLSQTGTTSSIQQPSFFTNVPVDRGENTNLTELTPMQSDRNMSNLQVHLPKAPQEANVNIPNTYCANNSAAKDTHATQTDWVFGNASVCFKPVKMSEIETATSTNSKENNSGAETSAEAGNISTSVVMPEENESEDVMNGPLILDEQAVPASILNLIPPNVSLYNSTANMPQAEETSTTTVQDAQSPTSRPLFPCTDCSQAFLSKQELDKHMKDHRKVLKCDLCNSTFTRMGNYTRHRKIHNLQPEKQNVYTCEYCNREFLQRCDLRRHKLIHTKQEPHRCDICGKGYIRRSDLVVHTRFHKKEKAFKCTFCDKSFFQSGDLGRHIRRTHKPSSQLTCGHCNRKYACETTLIRHMKVVHKDIILKTVNKRLQETSGNQVSPSTENLMFSMTDNSEGNANQEQTPEVSR